MEDELGPSLRSILHYFRSRQLFIGDELRLSTLRMAWLEAGQAPETFSPAIAELQRRGCLRTVRSIAGPAVQLTRTGFNASQQTERPTAPPASHEAPPTAAPLKTEAAARPVARTAAAGKETVSALLRQALPAAGPAAQNRPPKASATGGTGSPQRSRPAPSPARPAPPLQQATKATQRSRAETDQDIARSQVFRTRSKDLNDAVLKHCLLGLTQHYKLRAHGQLSYETIMHHWEEMGLSRSDLLYTLDQLISDDAVRTTSQPHEMIILTPKGLRLAVGAPKDLDDGMDRWQAKRRLRLTKRLGSLPAA